VKDALRARTDAAVAAGVIGVPTVRTAGGLFWGDDRLEEAVASAAA
jgi:2-hydroxychromene-2-carboxylate isomerase